MIRIFQALSASFVLLAATACAQETLPAQLKTTEDKASYGVGVNVALDLKRAGFAGFDMQLVLKGLQDVMADRTPSLSAEQRREAIIAFNTERAKVQAEKNKKAGAEYLAKFKTEVGVKTLPSGVAYKALKSGDGKTPKATDQVTVHYRGVLVDGTPFDSSYESGEPIPFRVEEVIDGWTQVLQQMKAGDKWKVVIPPELAYGADGYGPVIGPHATLVFEIELLKVESAGAAN
jgi:FKBP-type peptidyl-prolyl cis-trans isomerase FklB